MSKVILNPIKIGEKTKTRFDWAVKTKHPYVYQDNWNGNVFIPTQGIIN